MANTEPSARSAHQPGTRSTTGASQSRSTARGSAGTAGTAGGAELHSSIGDRAIAWARDARGLGRTTLEQLGVASGTAFFPKLGRRADGLFFRYGDGWKARSFPEKAFVSKSGTKPGFWNLDSVLAGSREIVRIVEGELDACALVEAGVPVDSVLSVPTGARERNDDDPERGFGYVGDALDAGLRRIKRFVLCVDGDGPGRDFREALAAALGKARTLFVDWPEGCKDANDMLLIDGAEALRQLVGHGALPWPVRGIYRLSEIPEPAKIVTWDPGFPEWGGRVKVAPRMLSVVTGFPGHGKSKFFTQFWYQIVNAYDLRLMVASFETAPKPHMRRQLRTLHSGLLECHMSEAQIAAADRWIDDHYLFVLDGIDGDDERPTFGWLLEKAEHAVIRHGVKIIVIDPWNRLESGQAPDETETAYIGRCLKAQHDFARDMNVHVQIIAHPSKQLRADRKQAPDLDDISGSQHWRNMPDQGFVIHRPEIFDGRNQKTEAVLYQKKARFEELGYECKLGLNYEIKRGRYVSTDYDSAAGLNRVPE
jgi:twinkle protein